LSRKKPVISGKSGFFTEKRRAFLKILRKTEKAGIVCISIPFQLFSLLDYELF